MRKKIGVTHKSNTKSNQFYKCSKESKMKGLNLTLLSHGHLHQDLLHQRGGGEDLAEDGAHIGELLI